MDWTKASCHPLSTESVFQDILQRYHEWGFNNTNVQQYYTHKEEAPKIQQISDSNMNWKNKAYHRKSYPKKQQ